MHSNAQLLARPRRRALSTMTLLALFAILLRPSPANAEPQQNKRVLMLAEMGMSSPPVFVVTQEITKALQTGPHQRIDFYFESLDTNLFSDQESERKIEDWLIEKYADRKPDVIVAGGPTPLRFLATSRRFFPDVPVVFVGSFKEQAQTLDLTARFTGIWFQFHPAKTLDVALRLIPDTRNVYVVGGISPIDRLAEKVFQEDLRPYEKKYKITYLTDLEMPEVLNQVSRLPEHSLVLFSLFFLDPAGRRFIPETQALPLIVKASNAPVFQLVDVGFGSGAVGGYVSSFAGQGREAAEDVLKILDGVPPSQIPQVDGPSQYMFDWQAIESWGLDKSKIPAGSVILFREPTMWQRYRPQILTAALVIFALSVLSLYLALETQRRKRAEATTAATLRFEQIISELSTHFIELPADNIDSGIAQALTRLVQVLNLERITVFRFTHDYRELEAVYFSTSSDDHAPAATLFAEECEWYFSQLRNRENVVLNRLSELPDTTFRRAFERHGVTSTVAVPIEFDGVVFGCLSFVQTRREAVWTRELVAQFKMVAQVIANALARKQADEQRQELSGLLINAEESERTRVARELHDDFSQRIAMLAVDLEMLPKDMGEVSPGARKRMTGLFTLATEIGADLHSLSHRLHSSTLDCLGLVDALEALCEEFAMQNEIDADFTHDDVPDELPPDIALCLFRIVQESLRNVKKHSQAFNVTVHVAGTSSDLDLSITDDGVGFNLDSAAKRVGLGLRSMQERIRLVGGRIQVSSEERKGTRIEVHIPLQQGAEETPSNQTADLERAVGD